LTGRKRLLTANNFTTDANEISLVMTDVFNSQKHLFLLDDAVTYLNCANMSPMLKSVKQAGLQALEKRAAPWNIVAADWFTNAEKLRTLAAAIFQTSNNNIALIPSASYGLALAAKNLQPAARKEIIILEQQFPSNYYVWQNLAARRNLQMVTVQRSEDKTLTESIIEKINSNTGIIAIPNCHWIDGAWIDLQKISDAAKTAGAYLVLDLSQSLGVLPIDIDSIQPDFAVSVGYKWLLGPYGLGYLYVSKRWQQEGEPLEYSWLTKKGSGNFAALTDYTTEYRDGARKFDMGEPPLFNSIPMAIAALEQIIQWKTGYIQTEIKKLTARIIPYKNKMGLPDIRNESVGHITSIPLQNVDTNALKERLQNNKVIISFRGNSIRVSPHLCNGIDCIDKLVACLQD
jgi:selenocysteine lyase/cysteine desulfurase